MTTVAKRAPVSLITVLTLAAGACSAGSTEDGPPVVEGEPIGVQGAHEHGVASMGLAVDGSVVTLDLEIPGSALFGFEHAPRTDDERGVVQAAVDRLTTRGGELVAFDPSLLCAAESLDVGYDAGHDPAEHHADGQHDPSHHPEGMPDDDEHSEVQVSVTWTCMTPPEGSSARLAVTELLPDVELVDLTVITSRGQAGARVGPEAAFRM